MNDQVRKRILCVDNCQDTGEILAYALGESGYEVEITQGVVQALQAVEQEPFACYLMALTFAAGTGFDLIERIRAIDPVSPNLVCTANVANQVQEVVLRKGAQDFFHKPVDLDQLIATISQMG